MKKFPKKIPLAGVLGGLVLATAFPAQAGTWHTAPTGQWYYQNDSDQILKSTITPDGYTVDENGFWDTSVPRIDEEMFEIEDVSSSEVEPQPFFQPDSTCNIFAGRKAEPIFRVLTDKPQVALTFDAAWNNTYTDTLLSIMAKYDVKSTYFMTGNWIRDYPEEVKKLVHQGHELANHSQVHKDFRNLSAPQMSALIQGAHSQVKELTGIDMCMFRAPSGEYNTSVVQAAKDNGYYYIQWTIDSLDWKNYGAADIVNRVLNSPKLAPGAIILLHDGSVYTPQALEAIIVGLLQKGYEIVPVSRLIYQDHFHMDVMGNQISDLPAIPEIALPSLS